MNTVDIPNAFVLFFDDYHEIDYFGNLLNQMAHPNKFKHCEIDFDEYEDLGITTYGGLYWCGTKPDKKQIEALVVDRSKSLGLCID